MCKENIIEIKMCVVRWRTTNKFDIIGLLPIKLEVAAPTQSWSAVCKQFQLYNPQWIISIKVKSAGTQKWFWNLLITKLFWKEIFTPFGRSCDQRLKNCFWTKNECSWKADRKLAQNTDFQIRLHSITKVDIIANVIKSSTNTHRPGRPLRINLMSRYICFSQIGPFDVSFEELFSKVQNPGGFFRKNVF